jgi:hypothetical protein
MHFSSLGQHRRNSSGVKYQSSSRLTFTPNGRGFERQAAEQPLVFPQKEGAFPCLIYIERCIRPIAGRFYHVQSTMEARADRKIRHLRR